MNNQTVNTPGFIFYKSYYEALSQLNPRQRHAIIDAVLEYAFTGVKPELKGTSGAILSVILPNIESCRKKYRGAAEKAKRSADEAQDNHEDTKASCEDRSTAEKSEARGKRIIDKEKEKDKEKKKENDTDMEKEIEKETEAASADEKLNIHASPQERSMRIISEYAGSDSELRSLLESWLDIKKQRGQPMNPESIRLNLEELTKITAGSDKKAYLREVIRRGWGTFFELEKKSYRKDSGGSDNWEDGGSSFDMEEFDRFTLGL